MRINRGRINKVIYEFLQPQIPSQGIIIICEGLPSVPNKKELMLRLSHRGFTVIYPRYKGTWESDGEFLKESPTRDVEDVLQLIKKGELVELFANKKFKIPNQPVHLLGSSFGASVALSFAGNKDISKIVALSAIVDFKKHNNENDEEDLILVGEFIKRAFGEGYRFKDNQWIKMVRGNIFNPPQKIDQKKANNILMVYDKSDSQVSCKKIEEYISNNKIKNVLVETDKGHLTFSKLPKETWDKIIKWLSIK